MNDPLYKQIKSLPKEYIVEKLNNYINEDSPSGDPTSDLTIKETKIATSFLVSEDSAIFCGSPIILSLDDFEVELLCNDGDWVVRPWWGICRLSLLFKSIALRRKYFDPAWVRTNIC